MTMDLPGRKRPASAWGCDYGGSDYGGSRVGCRILGETTRATRENCKSSTEAVVLDRIVNALLDSAAGLRLLPHRCPGRARSVLTALVPQLTGLRCIGEGVSEGPVKRRLEEAGANDLRLLDSSFAKVM
ncbi:hypothetical protein ACRRTK_009855 [Alexandromys fortis]